jgi:predicted HTH transcriptional regulator
MISDLELVDVLSFGAEQRGVEFKSAGSLGDGSYRARVIRAMIGMANRRDGGLVILGVADGTPLGTPGVSATEALEWTRFDDVADQVARYADPMLEFSTAIRRHDGSSFVVLHVEEFRELPVVCKKTFQAPNNRVILQEGAIYVRSESGKIETKSVSTAAEMRTLLELAGEKKLRAHIEATVRAGGAVVPAAQVQLADSQDHFYRELGDLA